MSVRDLLLEPLNNLGKEEFESFKWYLTDKVLDGCKPIAKYPLEDATRQKTVSLMIDTYGKEKAVNMTVAVLRKMGQNNAAEALDEEYKGSEEGKAASSTTKAASSTSSSSADARPVQPTISADHGSVIIAPTGTNTKGTWSITVEQS